MEIALIVGSASSRRRLIQKPRQHELPSSRPLVFFRRFSELRILDVSRCTSDSLFAALFEGPGESPPAACAVHLPKNIRTLAHHKFTGHSPPR